MAQQRLTQDELFKFDDFGNITLLHFADLHAQLMPVIYREPSQNLGAGGAQAQPPHITGAAFLKRFGIAPNSAEAYALTAEDFSALAKTYGRIGGLDRMATAVKAVRASRGEDRVLLLDGGDTWQGSLEANRTKGQAVIDCVKLLKPDAMTGHWEFTYGEDRVKEAVDAARLSVPRAQHPRYRMAGAGVSRLQDFRQGRASRSPCSAKPSPIRRSPIRAG